MGGHRHALTRFANSRIHQNIESETRGRDPQGRPGRPGGGRVDQPHRPRGPRRPGPAGAVGRRAATGRSPLAGGRRRRPDPADGTPTGDADGHGVADGTRWDEAVAAASPAERADAVAAFLAEGVAGQDGAGYCDTLAAAVAVATTGGRRARRSLDPLDGGRHLPGRAGGCAHPAGYGHRTSVRLADVTGGAGAAGASAARLCAASRRAGDLPPGEYAVVLMPECVAETLAFLAGGFSAKAVQEGQSFAVAGRAALRSGPHVRRRRRAARLGGAGVRQRGDDPAPGGPRPRRPLRGAAPRPAHRGPGAVGGCAHHLDRPRPPVRRPVGAGARRPAAGRRRRAPRTRTARPSSRASSGGCW